MNILTELISLTEAIDQQREKLVGRVISNLNALLAYLYKRSNCSFACSSILSGALARQMDAAGLLEPSPTGPFLGYNVVEMTGFVQTLESPTWSIPYRSPTHRCSLYDFLKMTDSYVVDGVEGLELGDFLVD